MSVPSLLAYQSPLMSADLSTPGLPPKAAVMQALVESVPSLSPRPLDIVCGRGDQHATHPGNVRFYRAIDSGIIRYDAATTKFEKSQVVHSIFQVLSSTSKFLRRHPGDGTYSLVADKDARQKISHALRYRKHGRPTPTKRSQGYESDVSTLAFSGSSTSSSALLEAPNSASWSTLPTAASSTPMPYLAQSHAPLGVPNNNTWHILSSAASATPAQYYSGFSSVPPPTGTAIFSEAELTSVLGDTLASSTAVQGPGDVHSHPSMSEEMLSLFSTAAWPEETTSQAKDASSEAARVFSSQFFG